MKDMEYMIQLISLFKNGKMTQFALEQEMALFLGGDCEVRIHNDPHATTVSSFGIFPLPEMHAGGLKVVYYIDKCALENFYNGEELMERLFRLSKMRQYYMKSYFKFISEHTNLAVSFCDALACLLKIYQSIITLLYKEGQDFLPDDITLNNIINSCEEGKFVDENLEKLRIDNIIPGEVIDAAKEMAHDSPDMIKTSIIFTNDDRASMNIFTQQRRTFCDGTYDWRHKEIPDDFKPSTNQ